MEVQEILNGGKNVVDFLKEKGFSQEKYYSDEEYKEGTYFNIDKRKLLVVYEVFEDEKIKEVKDHFLIDSGLSYCIIVLDEKLIFFRNFGETKHFIYSERTKNNPSKIDKLKNITTLDTLFQSKDISALFYEAFKLKRNLLVQNIKNDVEPIQKYLISQKIFDRFFFIYFLCHKGIIKFKDGGKISGENLFTKILLKKGNFLQNLKKLFHLFNSQEKNILDIGDYQIVIPYLNGGLFRPDVLEQDLNITLKEEQWEEIFEFLNSYHWIIEDVKVTEENEEKILTPEILGHVYERSVVEWESEGFEKEAENAVKKITERKKKGVYYTPESITDYISNNTIRPYLLDKLGNKYDDFDKLIESKNKKDMKDAIKILDEIKVLDPACGSGAFLIKASEVILGLKRRLYYELKDKKNFYDLKLDIITENIYGVDILSGAIEISKLRLWLWLISDYDDKSQVEPLPNIEYNLIQGNSLIGFTEFRGKLLEISKKLIEKTERFEKLKEEYKKSHGKKSDLIRELLEKEMKTVRTELNSMYIQDLNSRGVKNFKVKKDIQLNFFGEKNKDDKESYIYQDQFEKELVPFHWVLEFSEAFKKNSPGFDIVIGNPPYGDSVISDIQISILRSFGFKSLKETANDGGSKNGASLFIEQSERLLNEDGYFSFIVPNSIARVKQFEKIRLFLLNKVNLTELVDEGKPFKDVTLEMITLFYNKQKSTNVRITISRDDIPIKLNNNQYIVKKEIFIKYKQFIIYYDNLFDKIYMNSIIDVFDAKRGGDLKQSPAKNKEYCIPHLYSGKSVHEYYIDYNNIDYTTKSEIKNSTAKHAYENEFLISTKIYPFPRAIIKPLHMTIGAGVIKIDLLNNKITVKYALAILNSNLIKYTCYRYLVNLSQLTTNLNTGQLPLIPMKEISEKYQQPFIKLVDEILSITKDKDYSENKEKQKKVKELQEKIDQLVYKLYDLTPDEIKIVEGFAR